LDFRGLRRGVGKGRKGRGRREEIRKGREEVERRKDGRGEEASDSRTLCAGSAKQWRRYTSAHQVK